MDDELKSAILKAALVKREVVRWEKGADEPIKQSNQPIVEIGIDDLMLLIKQDREKNPLQGKFEKIMWVLAGNRSGESVTITISNTYGGLGSSYIGQEIVHQGRTLEKHLDRLIERLTPTNSGADHE